jgi:prepilin-type N-terminal cleavage/methylation domain-containing protein
MRSPRPAGGFTLMESVIAIAVVAVMLTTFLAVFGPASQGIRSALSVQDADRLASALEREMQLLREGPDDNFDTSFEKAYSWIRQSGNAQKAVLLYNYRGNPGKMRGDGTMEAYDQAGGVAGEDFVLQASVRRADDPLVEEDLETAQGQLFVVQMTQLVFDENGVLTLGEPGVIADPYGDGGSGVDNPDDYPEAVVAVSASFFALPSNSFSYLKNLRFNDGDDDGRPDNLGRPLFTRNLGVRR